MLNLKLFYQYTYIINGYFLFSINQYRKHFQIILYCVGLFGMDVIAMFILI